MITTSNSSRKKNTTEEKMKLVLAAAKLIKEDIKSIQMSHEFYPSCDDPRSQKAGIEFLPDTLKEFLKGLFSWAEYWSQGGFNWTSNSASN